MPKKKKEEIITTEEIIYPYKEIGIYEFFALRNPLHLKDLIPLVDDLFDRVPGEREEGKTAEIALLDILPSLVNKDPSVTVFVAMDKSIGKYIGFAITRIFSSPPPTRIWITEIAWDREYSLQLGKAAREFGNFIFDWIRKLGFKKVWIGTKTKKRIKAFQRMGFMPHSVVMTMDL